MDEKKEKAFEATRAATYAFCSLEEFKIVFEKFFKPCLGYNEAAWREAMECNFREMCNLAHALSTLLCKAMDASKTSWRATADAFVQVPMTTVPPGRKAPGNGKVLYLSIDQRVATEACKEGITHVRSD